MDDNKKDEALSVCCDHGRTNSMGPAIRLCNIVSAREQWKIVNFIASSRRLSNPYLREGPMGESRCREMQPTNPGAYVMEAAAMAGGPLEQTDGLGAAAKSEMKILRLGALQDFGFAPARRDILR